MGAPPASERLAVVTGGTRGIGRSVAERLRQAGLAVVVTGTRADGIPPPGCDYRAVSFEDDRAREAFAEEVGELGPLVLVNNAGITNPQAFSEIETAEFLRVHRINLVAPMRLCRSVLPGMRAASWGRIVNISSIWGVVGRAVRATYSSTKGGMNMMTASLAAEIAPDGILANCVAPGFIETDLMFAATTETEREELAQSVPMGRLGTPDEIGAFVAWLCSDENTYISGQTLVIDGGFCSGRV